MRHVSRRNNYDFLRLLAALAVVVQHATVHLDANFLWVNPGSPWWFYGGVQAFFIISGLFVYRSAEQLHARAGRWTDFYVNRALRIIPAIWAYLVVAVVVVLALGAATVGDLASVPGVAWIGSTLALVPAYSPGFLSHFGTGDINGSLWTIPAEVSFYVVVPLLVIAAARAGRRAFITGLLVLALAATGVDVMLAGSALGKVYDLSFAPYLWFFGLGIGWYFLRDRITVRGPWAAVAVVLYGVITALGHMSSPAVHLFLILAAGVPMSYVIVWAGDQGPDVMRRFTSRVGDLSFGTYIWHMPVVNVLLWLGVTDGLPGTVAVLLTIGLALVLAWLSWHLVERRALARKRISSRGMSELGDGQRATQSAAVAG